MSSRYFDRNLQRHVRRAARRGIRRNQRAVGGRGRRRQSSQGIFGWLGIVLLVVLAGAVVSWFQQGGAAPDGDGEAATLVRVIDGDTLLVDLDGEEERVRLLNIDTPETVHPQEPVQCMGPESTERMEELVSPGDQLVLEFDEERTDHYDRLLAGVFLDEVFINEQMARDGFGAPVYYAPNDRFLDQIEEAWNQAEAEGVGVFADDLDCEPELP
ncbi:thermonuclease family protein [Nesterenkonia lacusekhoensis]|uniref:Micrococcal nuclease n=1 Tax=Nesterenkonia lacusekhoensis TaxID=150832 RepID=A0ABS4SYM1_9MICC|nr:micrococcal nuclease [Nesterenkonia lacusekhoensis]